MRRSSSSHVAFLRAVNVAGHAIVKMNDLRDAFASAGCARARTFIQSGNVGFPNNFIEKELGVPATTRNWSSLRRIVEFARKEV